MTEQERLDLQCINTIRTLSMDAVQQANSGHPGTAMALAPALSKSAEVYSRSMLDPCFRPSAAWNVTD